jgi:glycosyltransferase involved in cell wall biosynthesis
MLTPPDLSLILPAYNEAARIGETLDSIVAHLAARGLSFELLVSVDGDDATGERALARARGDARVAVLSSAARRGKGRAVREAALGTRGRVVGYVDADGKARIQEMDKLLPWLERGSDVVIGSRARPESFIERPRPLHRRLGTRAFAALVHALVGLREVRDTQCGFKFFRGEVARELFARQRLDGYGFDVELLWLASALGYRIREVGIRWGDDGDSRLPLATGSLAVVRELWRIRRLGRPAQRGPAEAASPARTASAARR